MEKFWKRRFVCNCILWTVWLNTSVLEFFVNMLTVHQRSVCTCGLGYLEMHFTECRRCPVLGAGFLYDLSSINGNNKPVLCILHFTCRKWYAFIHK